MAKQHFPHFSRARRAVASAFATTPHLGGAFFFCACRIFAANGEPHNRRKAAISSLTIFFLAVVWGLSSNMSHGVGSADFAL